jgi:hypothetical protein
MRFGPAPLLLLALGACGVSNPAPGSSAYKQGELGNGGFLFRCDDSVACDRWSTNDAKDFPEQIATGATFNVRFVATGDEGSSTTSDKYVGLTSTPVEPYVSSGPDGFTTLKPGYGVIAARDSSGAIVDYVQLRIVKPDGLVVYPADYKGNDPPAMEAINLKLTDARRSYRTVAERAQTAVAGSVRVVWASSDTSVIQIESYTRGVVNVVAKSVGKATLRVEGAALTKDIAVEVTP